MADSWMYQPLSAQFGQPIEQETKTLETPPTFAPAAATSPGLSALRDNSSPAEIARTAAAHRVRRRNRVINSCLECRRRKLKCDKLAPCTNCVRFKRDCLYLAPSLDSLSQAKLADMKEKMGALEKNLEREVAGRTPVKPHIGGANVTRSPLLENHTHVDAEEEDEVDGDDEDVLEPTPLASLDNTYEDGGDDELMDLGVQMGKMRISERIGGWVRPKLVDELNDTLKDVTAGKSRWSNTTVANDHREVNPEGAKIQASPKSYIGPGPDYIAPASSFFFPGTNMNTSMLDYLPSQTASDQLIARYFAAVHPVCRAVHRQTFEAQYSLFWGQVNSRSEPARAIQAVMFAAMFSAAVSLDDVQAARTFGTSRAALIDSFRSATEMALAKANFLRTTRVDVMQAFVMYLIPLVRAEVSRAHSALVGTAIRLAECMGLHRDGSLYSMSPVEVHVRRLIWHQLCFLDLRTCEATGPRPQIRPGDYDTKLPLNVDDLDFLSNTPPTEDEPYWTDATIIRIRAEYVELRRQTWFDVVQIDKKKKSLTSSVIKTQKVWKSMTEHYFPMMDADNPLHTLGRHILTLGIQGCFLQLLHRYLFSAVQRMPDRLRQILIEAGLTQMENAIALETNPQLAIWSWYRGAFNQYHSALLLMIEVYAYPMRKDAPKIWKCLDYIFDIPPHLTPKQKAELVITDLRDRMEVYHQLRKLKATTQMEERVSSLNKSSVLQGWDVDGKTKAPPAADTSFNMPPLNFSPPPVERTDSTSGDSRHNSAVPGALGGGGDVAMHGLEDIDWAEWDKYFPIEQNTGELNLEEYDMSTFNGGLSGPPLDPSVFAAAAAVTTDSTQPLPEDLGDISFTPTFYPNMSMRTGGSQGYPGFR
ncbi:hypothetical protein LTR78_008742 [Recurvomyces mirabilis]|uniref:Zn(2)-C6 fungal-type domain-containing protein n=1 Tax=Recurvomyces mirabilis TaxID=574656 RepID=A0AAE0TPM8_9PEZI|nr:hypothetical protein LTR78_008742 [Recurvomyces mirabilis]KAK5159172.1 hypothetical protein LTS14_002314 [Recurvomyces mirabilis]